MDATIAQTISSQSLAVLFEHGINIEGLDRILGVVRRHLEMDVAFISHFRTQDRVLVYLDHDKYRPCVLSQGQRIPLKDGYCAKVVCGELPECIPNTAKVPETQSIYGTKEIPIGAHLSVPIKLNDGGIYGTLCCFSYYPKESIGDRDMRVLRAFGEVLSVYFDSALKADQERVTSVQEIKLAVAHGAPRIVYQPVFDIADHRLHGFECLSRFDVEPYRSPDKWFDTAYQVGMGLELELKAVTNALLTLDSFPRNIKLNINSSPELILSGLMLPLLTSERDLARMVLEITEHTAVKDYSALVEALAPFRARGITLAVDDAGAGYSSMRHILNLEPDVIKLDMSLTQSVDIDQKRKALAKGLTSFAHEIGCLVVAEGVETKSELDTLAKLNVDCAQGYFLSKPIGLDEAIRLCQTQ